MKDYRNTNVRPQDDFFEYATGKWLDENPQPDEYPVWTVFTKMHDENVGKIKEIIENPDGSTAAKKMERLYRVVLDDERRQREGVEPVKRFLKANIEPIGSKDELMAFLCKEREFPFLSLFNDADMKDSKMHTIYLWQSGLSLGNKEYYLSHDEDKEKVMAAFKVFFKKVLKKFGISEDDAQRRLEWLLNIETGMAYHSYSIEDQQEPSKNYHPYTVADASDEYSLDFVRMLKLYGYDNTTKFIVAQPEAVKEAARLWRTTPFKALKEYVEAKCMMACCGVTDDEMYDIDFEFSQVISGAKKQQPKWKRAVNKINGIFSPVVGQIYANRYFGADGKKYAEALVDNMKRSYAGIIEGQKWMSADTKAKALEKLDKMGRKIGYPKKFDDLTDIPVDPNKSLFDNMHDIADFMFELDKKKHYNKPVDPDEWHMSPQTVNAYYSTSDNEVVFPAGILQVPYFSLEYSDAENYGSIGAVIGHEMTHGFDNHGRQYDINGNLNDWWGADDIEKFTKMIQPTKERFNSLEALPGLKCNGSLTLGENLADYGGIKIAYNALKYKIGRDLTRSEKDDFFRAYALSWAGTMSDESIRNQVLNNEHSVCKLRVNGTLPMFDEWCNTYEVKDGDGMYVAPEKRAKIW